VPAITLSSRSQGLVRGSYGFDVILEEIDQADDVAIGEDVITSGVGGRYPEGLLIGSVRKVESQKNKIFKSATLKLPFEIRKLERVFVIR
jgi:rod shape-determining protein MreC